MSEGGEESQRVFGEERENCVESDESREFREYASVETRTGLMDSGEESGCVDLSNVNEIAEDCEEFVIRSIRPWISFQVLGLEYLNHLPQFWFRVDFVN